MTNNTQKNLTKRPRLAVIGTGNVGSALAADQAIKGNPPLLIKSSARPASEHLNWIRSNDNSISLEENGIKQSARLAGVTDDLARVAEAEIIAVCIQTTYHEDLIKRLVPHLHDEQILLFIPGYLSTAYCLKHGIADGVTIAEAQSSFIDCSITAPGEVRADFRNVRNPVGVYPHGRTDAAMAMLDRLDERILPAESIFNGALHNPNLIVHTVGGIMSIPRTETLKDKYVMYHEVFTPSVWNIVEALDSEKMAVLRQLGSEPISYLDVCAFRNSLDREADPMAVFLDYAHDPQRKPDPDSVTHRFITEDVPQGLVMLESLGAELGIMTPVTTSLIEIASAALVRNMREGGRTLERLGQDNIETLITDRDADRAG